MELLNRRSWFIKQKMLGFKYDYQIMDENKSPLGRIEEKANILKYILDMLDFKFIIPTTFYLKDANGEVLAVMKKEWGFWKPPYRIYNNQGMEIGKIQEKVFTLTAKMEISSGGRTFRLNGGLIAWDFSLLDEGDREAAHISKKFAGLLKEMFTEADNYAVEIHEPLDEDIVKTILLSTTVIDYVYKSN